VNKDSDEVKALAARSACEADQALINWAHPLLDKWSRLVLLRLVDRQRRLLFAQQYDLAVCVGADLRIVWYAITQPEMFGKSESQS
jgi:hypothetical protein